MQICTLAFFPRAFIVGIVKSARVFFFTGCIVIMVTCYITGMITTCLPLMIGILCDSFQCRII